MLPSRPPVLGPSTASRRATELADRLVHRARGAWKATGAEKPVRILLSAFPWALKLRLLALPPLFRASGNSFYRFGRTAYRMGRGNTSGAGERRIGLHGVDLYLPTPGSLADLGTLYEIFISEDYRADYSGAVVVDLGAHKGYYGAYAVVHGARAILSYEPETSNFSFLERTANSLAGPHRPTWQVIKAAVGSSEGEAQLHVSGDSWTHSLMQRPGKAIGGETVRVVGMSTVLAHARSLAPGRVVVKMDVEGAECDIVRDTPLDCWREVDEVFVEVHGFSSCSVSDIVARLGPAGLTRRPSTPGMREAADFVHDVLRFSRGSEP